MTILTQLNPLQWSTLPDIDDVDPLSEEDEACLQDIKTVLEKHGRLSKFGVALLHTHFALKQNELMLEVCDVDNRTLVAKPVNMDFISSENIIETLWRFDQGSGSSCADICWKQTNGQHPRRHEAFPPEGR